MKHFTAFNTQLVINYFVHLISLFISASSVIINKALFCSKNSYVDQGTRKEDPDENPCKYSYLIYEKLTKIYIKRKLTSSIFDSEDP